MKQKLILASASPRREKLLKQLGLHFTVVPSNINEDRYLHLPPVELVNELSLAKAEEVAELVENTVIIAADTIVVLNDAVIGKPEDTEDAKKMLQRLSGTKHTVYSGLAVLSTENGFSKSDYDQTDVYIRNLSDREIDAYIRSGEPMDKAGAYGIQGLGGIFVERINGSFFTVMGLPIHILSVMLKDFAINIL
ncbi:MAG: Maf family protein [Halanaerobiaceae bacterium]